MNGIANNGIERTDGKSKQDLKGSFRKITDHPLIDQFRSPLLRCGFDNKRNGIGCVADFKRNEVSLHGTYKGIYFYMTLESDGILALTVPGRGEFRCRHTDDMGFRHKRDRYSEGAEAAREVVLEMADRMDFELHSPTTSVIPMTAGMKRIIGRTNVLIDWIHGLHSAIKEADAKA
ncbi:MAG: hypothetical protein KGH59_03350 [Candidatus Micrarchaeota archaeon]|nr:hypothetical protein [Candidatus Micrarchaeota archaeon]MDE1804792.1 hypothetical protein [Candidatus Micrarchaeota archaeon]MDE1847189.1 hypothetical protein [Candidatus Micrarchaeota archaeon]